MTRARRRKTRKAARRTGGKVWSAQAVGTLRRMYRTKTNREIGRKLRRSIGSVAAKARSLRLRKPVRRAKASSRRRR